MKGNLNSLSLKWLLQNRHLVWIMRFFGPSFAPVNEANESSLHSCISDFLFTNFWFLWPVWRPLKCLSETSFPVVLVLSNLRQLLMSLARGRHRHSTSIKSQVWDISNVLFSLSLKLLKQGQSEKGALELEGLKIRCWCSMMIATQFRVRCEGGCLKFCVSLELWCPQKHSCTW